jgi:DNA helicase-2/ATP-dependent DNA helicase PcrA
MEGPLLVLAGPGSGKTRVITYRIAALIESGVQPWNICAITFTNKAAEEMRQRAVALGVAAGTHISTFHSLCVRILRRYAEQAGIDPHFSIYDEADQTRCIKKAITDCELDTSGFPPGQVLDAISSLKNKLIEVESFKQQADGFRTKKISAVYARYQQILGQQNSLDFDDLLLKAAILLRDRTEVRRELGNRFRFLLVDEYQDTNNAQYVIAKALASEHRNICVTGDPDQSIYRWRGADIRNIMAFEKDWPDARVVRLEENFRSTANILVIADRLIANNRNRRAKMLIPVRTGQKEVCLSVFDDGPAEALAVARQIQQLVDEGACLRDMAVFYRVNSMSRAIEEAFIRSKIPYQVVRGVEFYNRKEVRDILAYLRVLANPKDEAALLRIINTPTRGIGKTTIDRVVDYAGRRGISVLEALGQTATIDSLGNVVKARIAGFLSMLKAFAGDIEGEVAPLIRRVFVESGLKESLIQGGSAGQDAVENVEELIAGASEYDEQAEELGLVDYLQQISLFSDTDAYDTSRQCVALMTLHAAKGLEFENVFVVGLEEDLLPHHRANVDENEEELEEERRLLFVGITRAKTGLYLSHAQYRTVQGQIMRTIPSRFLSELGLELHEGAGQDDQRLEPDHFSWPAEHFVAGERVLHKKFGFGRVESYADMGEKSIVVVRFNTGQTKSLLVKSAGLMRM